MKKVQILGTGCPSCRRLADLVEYTARELGLECDIQKIADLDEILEFDVAGTPALVVDGQVKASGCVPTVVELRKMLT